MRGENKDEQRKRQERRIGWGLVKARRERSALEGTELSTLPLVNVRGKLFPTIFRLSLST